MTKNGQSTLLRQLRKGGAIDGDGLDKQDMVAATQ